MLIIILSLIMNIRADEPLQVAFGLDRKPFIFEKTQNGIVQNLFNETIKNLNLKLKVSHLPNIRLRGMLEQDLFDILVEVHNRHSATNHNYYFSDKFIAYYNYFISKKDKIKTYSELTNKSVCAWQNAKENLGINFTQHLSKLKSYKEFAEQEEQVLAFVRGQCDVLIIDRDIFHYYEKKLQSSNKLLLERNGFKPLDINLHPLPENSELWWYVAFKSKKLRDQFNLELKKITDSNRYKYLREVAVTFD